MEGPDYTVCAVCGPYRASSEEGGRRTARRREDGGQRMSGHLATVYRGEKGSL